MSDVLNSLDVVNQHFKKALVGGYSTEEVDEFLDAVAESIQSYVQKTKDLEREIDSQKETIDEYKKKLDYYDGMTNSIKDALMMAQEKGESRVKEAEAFAADAIATAQAKAGDMIAEAKLQADRLISEARERAAESAMELQKLREIRSAGLAYMRSFAHDVLHAADRAEREGAIELPDFAIDLVRTRGGERAEAHASAQTNGGPVLVEHHHAEFLSDGVSAEEERSLLSDETKKAEVSETLSALGIDPDLLNSDI